MKSHSTLAILSLAMIFAACSNGGSDATQPSVAAPAPTSSPPPLAPAITRVIDAGIAASAALPESETCGLADFERELIERINAARHSPRWCGSQLHDAVAPLTWNAKLSTAARVHSTDMSSHDYFSHTSRDGRTIGDRITAAGYAWASYAENLAAGQVTIDEVMNDWLNSPEHCANVMKSHLTEVGGACVIDEASTYKMYWSMDFANPA